MPLAASSSAAVMPAMPPPTTSAERVRNVRCRGRSLWCCARAIGALEDLPGLRLGELGLVLVDEAAALAQVGEGDGVLAQPQLAGDALEGRALEARRAAGDDQVVESAVLHGLADQVVALGAAHELVDGDAR